MHTYARIRWSTYSDQRDQVECNCLSQAWANSLWPPVSESKIDVTNSSQAKLLLQFLGFFRFPYFMFYSGDVYIPIIPITPVSPNPYKTYGKYSYLSWTRKSRLLGARKTAAPRVAGPNSRSPPDIFPLFTFWHEVHEWGKEKARIMIVSAEWA
jgi:hypothetical protein